MQSWERAHRESRRRASGLFRRQLGDKAAGQGYTGISRSQRRPKRLAPRTLKARWSGCWWCGWTTGLAKAPLHMASAAVQRRRACDHLSPRTSPHLCGGSVFAPPSVSLRVVKRSPDRSSGRRYFVCAALRHVNVAALQLVMPAILANTQETLKSVIAQYNASQLITMREVRPGERFSRGGRAGRLVCGFDRSASGGTAAGHGGGARRWGTVASHDAGYAAACLVRDEAGGSTAQQATGGACCSGAWLCRLAVAGGVQRVRSHPAKLP